MLGLTPNPLSAGVGMHVAVAGPYGHERVTAWQDDADAQRKNTAGGSVSSGRARAPDGALAPLSQTTVYDTCGSATPACGRLPADLRTHPGWAQGRAAATAAGRSRWRKPRCGWPRPRWRTATPQCPSSAVNSGFSAAGRCTDVYVLVRISTFDVSSCDT